MQLREYLFRERLTLEKFGKRCRISTPQLSKINRGLHAVKIDDMIQIIDASEGAVTAEDLVATRRQALADLAEIVNERHVNAGY